MGTVGMILPKHLFAAYTGAKSREAPRNLAPVGTGPYRFSNSGPATSSAASATRPTPADRPYFDSIEMKGGGDAVSAARAVLQTGEYDYAWNLLVEDEVLKRLETGGKGRVDVVYGGKLEFCCSTPPTRTSRSMASAPRSRPSTRPSPTRRSATR